MRLSSGPSRFMADVDTTSKAEESGKTLLQVTVAVCVAPREVREWTIQLPRGATVGDALRISGAQAECTQVFAGEPHLGVWGRAVNPDVPVQHLDRVEAYRPLLVDPKVARRERFARQGARTTGLFARQRPGGKAGY